MPTMLYRRCSEVNPAAWNKCVETRVVEDEDIDTAQGEGWLLAADILPTLDEQEPGPFDTFLDSPIKELVPLLPEMTKEELQQLRAAEVGGKTRAGLIAEIDKAIESKG